MTTESQVSLFITCLIILYCKACSWSKKPNLSMDRMNLHRAGLVVVRRYSDPNDSGIHNPEWEVIEDDSEGRYCPN